MDGFLQSVWQAFISMGWQIIQLVGVIVLVNFYLAFLDKYRFKKSGHIPLTAYIGVPVHEFSHLLTSMAFGHQITEVRFLKSPKEDGVLGYVNFLYDENSMKQQIGLFFSAVAPVLTGGGFLLTGIYYSMPTAAKIHIRSIIFENLSFREIVESALYLYQQLLGQIANGNIAAIVIVILSICVASHMVLSSADWYLVAMGGGFLVGVLFTANLIGIGEFVGSITAMVANFALIVSIFSLVYGTIGFLCNVVFYTLLGRK